MFLNKFIKIRDAVASSILDVPQGDSVSLKSNKTPIQIPFDVDGTPLMVSRQIDFESIDVDFRTFDSTFVAQQGGFTPIKTYHDNIMNVLNSLSDSEIQAIINPAPDEQLNEK